MIEARPSNRAGFFLKGNRMAWNRPSGGQLNNNGVNGRKNHVRPKGIVFGAAVLALGLILLLYFVRFDDGYSAMNEQKMSSSDKSPEVSSTITVPVTDDVVTIDVEAAKPAETGNVTIARQTVQMRTLEDGTKVPIGRNYFTNHIERALSTLCNPGGMAIPLSAALRRFSDEEIMRILNAPMEYDKNDSEFIMARKMQMQQIKGEILAYIKDGNTLRDALKEADKTIRRDGSYLMMTRKHLSDALKTGDGEVIREYVKKLNEDLVERGMRPLEIPNQYRAEGAEEEGDR